MLDLLIVNWLTLCAVGGLVLHKLDKMQRQPESVRQDIGGKQGVLSGIKKQPVEPVLPYSDQQLVDAFRALATSKLKER